MNVWDCVNCQHPYHYSHEPDGQMRPCAGCGCVEWVGFFALGVSLTPIFDGLRAEKWAA